MISDRVVRVVRTVLEHDELPADLLERSEIEHAYRTLADQAVPADINSPFGPTFAAQIRLMAERKYA